MESCVAKSVGSHQRASCAAWIHTFPRSLSCIKSLPHQLLYSLRAAAIYRRDLSSPRSGSILGQPCLRTHGNSGGRVWTSSSPWGHPVSGLLSTKDFLCPSHPGLPLFQQLSLSLFFPAPNQHSHLHDRAVTHFVFK